jgi:CBS domain-containing protein
MKLKDVLEAKGQRVVPDAEGCPVGIFTERGVVRLHADGDRDLDALTLVTRMTCSVVVGRLSMSVGEALGLMTERRFRHLPVIEDG